MAVSNAIQKTLVMKPEVTQIFEDLEAWHDHCRFEMINFNPADLYKSKEYKAWVKENKRGPRGPRKAKKAE